MTASPAAFALRLRVPSWTKGMTLTVNGSPVTPVEGTARPGAWATINRTWTTGDVVVATIPLVTRMEPVDRFHPDRVAVVRGPVVMVLEGAYHDPNFSLPMSDEDLATWFVPEPGTLPRGEWATGLPPTEYATSLRVERPDKKPVRLRFRPFYEVTENYPYFMYFDRGTLPWRLW